MATKIITLASHLKTVQRRQGGAGEKRGPSKKRGLVAVIVDPETVRMYRLRSRIDDLDVAFLRGDSRQMALLLGEIERITFGEEDI